jgi:hypothetical protein
MGNTKPNTTLHYSARRGNGTAPLCQSVQEKNPCGTACPKIIGGKWRIALRLLTSIHERSNPSSLPSPSNPCNSTPLYYSAGRPTLASSLIASLVLLCSPILLCLSIVYTYPRAQPFSPTYPFLTPWQESYTPISEASP